MLFLLSALIAMSEATKITLIFGMVLEYTFPDTISVDFELTIPIETIEKALWISIGFQHMTGSEIYDGLNYDIANGYAYDCFGTPNPETNPIVSFRYDKDTEYGGTEDVANSLVFTQDESFGYLTWNRLLNTGDEVDITYEMGQIYQIIYGYSFLNIEGNNSTNDGMKEVVDSFYITMDEDADDQDVTRIYSFLY